MTGVESGGGSVVSARADRRVSPAVAAFVVAAAALLLFTLFTTPIGQGADESAHIVKAASLWEGQVRGPVGSRVVDGQTTKADIVTVPASLSDLYDWAHCPPARAEDGDCTVDVPTGGPRESYTAAGPYPLAYYAIVGWVSQVLDGSAAVYGMRLMTVIVNIGLLGSAMALAARRRRGGWMLAATMIGVTPMAAFSMSTVNPNGLEFAACAAAFAAGALLLAFPDPRRSELVLFTLASALAVNTRSLSPLFYGLGVLMLLFVAGVAPVRRLLADRSMRWSIAVIAVAGAAATAWVAAQGHLGYVPGAAVPEGRSAAVQMVLWTPMYLRQMVSGFYGLDSGIDNLIPAGWYFAAVVVLGALVLAVSTRDRIKVALLASSFVILPFIIQLPATKNGLAWHGRYLLLLVPAFGYAVVHASRGRDVRLPPLLRLAAAAAVAVAWLWAGVEILRFHVGGSDLLGAPVGPLPAVVVLAFVAAGAAASAFALVRATADDAGDAGDAL